MYYRTVGKLYRLQDQKILKNGAQLTLTMMDEMSVKVAKTVIRFTLLYWARREAALENIVFSISCK